MFGGFVTNTSDFTGDVEGTRDAGLTVTGIAGTAIDRTNPLNVNQGYMRLSGDNLVPVDLVWIQRSTNSGNVRGQFDTGLNLQNIYGGLIDPNGAVFSQAGQGLVFDGDYLAVTQLDTRRLIYATGDITAQVRDVITCNTVAAGFTVTLPPAAVSYTHLTLPTNREV